MFKSGDEACEVLAGQQFARLGAVALALGLGANVPAMGSQPFLPV
jgi:hypothetical protein